MTREQMSWSLVGLLVLVAGVACMKTAATIPNGIYSKTPGDERISVNGPNIHFTIQIVRDGSRTMVNRDCQYEVGSDGRIRPFPLRSADAVFGVGSFDWYWDGGSILQKDPRTGDILGSFVRTPAHK